MNLKRISVEEIKKRLDKNEQIMFIDTRNEEDWGKSNVKVAGAQRLHYSQLGNHLAELPKDRLIITYCT